MCKRITCSTCDKPGWQGCGAHVEQVLGDVDPKDRCSCSAGSTKARKTKSNGLLGRILNR